MTNLNTKKIIPILKGNNVVFAGLFGSYARNEAKKGSDVDLLVRFNKPKGLFAIVSLQRELSQALGRKVDLVTEGALSPYIKDNVFNNLKVMYGKR